ncbi:MAG TPA: hypothetical protein VNX21_04325 [Candidatus Thermoplasmatota archaeon]|nr:hypothetical protein [Candidatus Thermoplasmatota archaeon]
MRLADALVVAGWWALSLAGALFALLYVGVLLIADKPNEPRQYALEVGVAVGLLLLGVVAAVGGAWLALRKLRRTRGAAGKPL